MKTVLVLAAALGLSVSAAAAECAGHVSASVDKKLTVASIEKDTMSKPADTTDATVLQQEEIKKND